MLANCVKQVVRNKIYYALMQKINLNTRHPKNNFKCFTRLQAYLIKNLKIDNTYRKITNQKPSKLIKITSKMWLRMIYSSNRLGHGISKNLFELWISKQLNRSKHSNTYQDPKSVSLLNWWTLWTKIVYVISHVDLKKSNKLQQKYYIFIHKWQI